MLKEWSMDELSYVRNPRNHFHIGHVRFLYKKADDMITIAFDGGAIELTVGDKKTRDDLFEWFISCRVAYAKACRTHEELHHKIQGAQLEIQNRMAAAVVNHTHES